jgi:toxin ParE1/3/4
VATQISLTAAASRDVTAILRHSARTFGSAQRRVYWNLIQQALKRIADEPLCVGSEACEELGAGFRLLPVARVAARQSAAAHVVYYKAAEVNDAWSVTVLRVLHNRMDPERHVPGEKL